MKKMRIPLPGKKFNTREEGTEYGIDIQGVDFGEGYFEIPADSRYTIEKHGHTDVYRIYSRWFDMYEVV